MMQAKGRNRGRRGNILQRRGKREEMHAPTLFQSLLKLGHGCKGSAEREGGREGDREYMKIDWHGRERMVRRSS